MHARGAAIFVGHIHSQLMQGEVADRFGVHRVRFRRETTEDRCPRNRF